MKLAKQLWINVIVLTLIVAAAIVFPYSQYRANAQDSPKGMSQLLTVLNDRTHKESGFSIHFSFAVPLVEGEEDWVIPTGDTSSLRHITIDSIGADHICFGDLGGSAYGIRCTPFSNIVQVFWVDN